MDVGTGLALFGTAKLAEKLLGPTADYLGQGMKTWAESRMNNLRNIFSIAIRKLGDEIQNEGAVPNGGSRSFKNRLDNVPQMSYNCTGNRKGDEVWLRRQQLERELNLV